MTSPDGINWTGRSASVNNNWFSVCWAPSLTLFCAVGSTGTGTRAMTSPDGITWTTRTSSADSDWRAVCWSPDLSLFCAVAELGVIGARVMTSPDGINWTSRTVQELFLWYAVAWSPKLGLFCATAASTSTNNIMTSPDGITWTSRTGGVSYNLHSVAWAPGLDIFCIISDTNNFLTSPDGINWTLRTNAVNRNWYDVCWSPDLGWFAAVGTSGTGDRVMTWDQTASFEGSITETLDVIDWVIDVYRMDTAVLLTTVDATDGYYIDISASGYTGACLLLCRPKTGDVWEASAVYALDDYVLATDPEATPHLWQCTTAGTSDSTEPVWNLSGTTADNTVTWTYIAALVDPVVLAPRIPRI